MEIDMIRRVPDEWAGVLVEGKKKKTPKDVLWMYEVLGWDK